MINRFIIDHPNPAKPIVYMDAYFSLRLSLMKTISNIEQGISSSILSGDVDITKSLLPDLKTKQKELKEYFESVGYSKGTTDPHMCAEILLDAEKEYYPDPLDCCRYLNVEHKDSEFNNNKLLKEYEEKWMIFKKTEDGRKLLLDDISEYICYGLLRFADYDKTPLSLKALLFNRYCHWNRADTEGFKIWYITDYWKNLS